MYLPTGIPGVCATKIRDLNYFRIGESVLVFACDSSGAVGCMPKDESYRTAQECSVMFPKCVLMEMLAAGIEPIALYNDFCYEASEELQQLCGGIKAHCDALGLKNAKVFNKFASFSNPGSTAYGVTAVGVARSGSWKVCCSRPGDIICALGTPSKRMQLETQVTPAEVRLLRQQEFVHELLPCGSRGIFSEARDLAASNGLRYEETRDHALFHERNMSCGASAVVLVTLRREDLPALQALQLPRPITVIGTLEGEKTIGFSAYGCRTQVTVTDNGDILLPDGCRIVSRFVSAYGMGQMEQDEQRVPAQVLLRLAHQLLPGSGNEAPLLVINNLNFSMNSGGRHAIDEMVKMLSDMGLCCSTQFTGSTEDNHVAVQSGYALRVFSLCSDPVLKEV